MTKEKVESIIKFLEAIREKPMLFVGADLSGIVHFLNGFDFATAILDLNVDYRKTFESAVLNRGWTLSPSLENELKERGLNKQQIANELTEIRIETWEKILSEIDK